MKSIKTNSHVIIKAIYPFIFLFSIYQISFGQELSVPTGYTVLDSVSGDLDNDSIAELVVAYNVGTEKGIDGLPRELVIYKRIDNKFTEWKKSAQALLASEEGGMMGDPYEAIEIQNGILLIRHGGGSSWKWTYTDKYRFQDGAFFLIGYTGFGGKLCEEWLHVDFNLSSGMLVVKKEYEKCESQTQDIFKVEAETFYQKDLKITMQNRNERMIRIVTPKYGHVIYIALGKDY